MKDSDLIGPRIHSQVEYKRLRLYSIVAITLLALVTLHQLNHGFFGNQDAVLNQVEFSMYKEGLARCRDAGIRPKVDIESSRENPRFEGGQSILLRNASLIDGDGTISFRSNILMDRGIFTKISNLLAEDVGAMKDVLLYDVQGRFVTPGLIDMHSHAGVGPQPMFNGNEDVNEVSGPITSQMRTIDAIDTDDIMFKRIMSGGVTSSLILPGSANVMGGEAFAIKYAYKQSRLVEDYLVQSGVNDKRQRWIKMACGENPKAVYPDKTASRMGVAWQFRKRELKVLCH